MEKTLQCSPSSSSVRTATVAVLLRLQTSALKKVHGYRMELIMV